MFDPIRRALFGYPFLLLLLSCTITKPVFIISALPTVRSLPFSFQVEQTYPLHTNQHQPVLVTFFHQNFTEDAAVRLASNVSAGISGGACEEETVYANWNAVPTGTISNIVKWTPYDPDSFLVASFTLDPVFQRKTTLVYPCFTTDQGKTWKSALLVEHHAKAFQLWRASALPLARPRPLTATVGSPLYISVTGAHLSPGTKAILVTSASGCGGAKPADVLKVTQNATWDYERKTFTFVPLEESVSGVYLCVSQPVSSSLVGGRIWTLIPFDEKSVMVFRNTHYGTFNLPNHHGLAQVGIPIYPENIKHLRADFSCQPPTFIAGLETLCTIGISNASQIPTLSATDLQFVFLSDGSGKLECPFPTLRQSSVTGDPTKLVEFSWTPQRLGREGTLQLLYKNYPLFFHDNALNQAYYRRIGPNNGNFTYPEMNPFPGATRDLSVTKFFVEPGFSELENYDYQNYLDIHYFSPREPKLILQDGVPAPWGGRHNNSLAKEMKSLTLKQGEVSGAVSQQVALPVSAKRCRLTVHYVFNGDNIEPDRSIFIASAKVILVDGGGSDILTLRNYQLYSLFRRVIVVGGDHSDILDGDVRVQEQLVADVPLHSDVAQLRLELSLDHSTSYKFYWLEPVLKCSTGDAPSTPESEIRALQRFYDAVHLLGTSQLTNWKRGAGSSIWNGDPCREHWKGVDCRNYHIVHLNLQNSKLSGSLTNAGHLFVELPWLEVLNLRNNQLTGIVPTALANNTRLQFVDLSQNYFTNFESEFIFSATAAKNGGGTGGKQICLRELHLSDNQFQMKKFPEQVTSLPKLEVLDFSKNALQSTVPLQLFTDENLPNLRHLDLSRNFLHGSLPHQLPWFPIVSADFSNNQFNGTIPFTWGQNLLHLKFLDVSKNQLHGEIPHSLSRIRSSGAMTFRGADNMFRGFFPRLPFEVIDLRENFFKCPLPVLNLWAINPVVGLENEMSCDYYQ